MMMDHLYILSLIYFLLLFFSRVKNPGVLCAPVWKPVAEAASEKGHCRIVERSWKVIELEFFSRLIPVMAAVCEKKGF